MSNFIPGNYPSPDQANVYYNIQAVIARMRGNLLDETLDSLNTQLLEYQLPTFVLDESNAPNSYIVKIYPKDAPDDQIYVSDESVTNAAVSPSSPPMIDTSPENIKDAGIPIILDPRFHSNSRIKEGDFSFVTATESNWSNNCTLISTTKFVLDSSTVGKNNQNAEIIRNIVANQIIGLPEDLQNEYAITYEDTVEKIEELLSTLQRVVDGEKETIDKIADTLIGESYYGGNLPSIEKSLVENEDNRKSLSSKYIGNAFWQLARQSNGGSAPNSSQLPYTGHFDSPTEMIALTEPKDNSSNQKYTSAGEGVTASHILNDSCKFWKSFLKSPELAIDLPGNDHDHYSASHWMEFPTSTTSNNTWMEQLLKYTSGSETKYTFDPVDGWMKTWYYDNLADQIEKKQVNFDSMDGYIAEFSSRLKQVKEEANLYALEGNGLTVIQAIIRAITKLSQNNLDVAKYAPRWHNSMKHQYAVGSPLANRSLEAKTPDPGLNIFQALNRSSILGVSGAHPSPSLYSRLIPDEVGEGDNAIDLNDLIDPVKLYSNNSFLNFNALITILSRLHSEEARRSGIDGLPSAKKFIVMNLKNLDSNHDSVIKLWECISDTQIGTKTNFHHQKFHNNYHDASNNLSGSDENEWYAGVDEGMKSVRELACLYKKNEGIQTQPRLYLLPTTPRLWGSPPHMRSFMNFRLKPTPFLDWLSRNNPDNFKKLVDSMMNNIEEFKNNNYITWDHLPISDGNDGTGGGELLPIGIIDGSLLTDGDSYCVMMGMNATMGPVQSSLPENGRQEEWGDELFGGGGNAGAPGWMTGMPHGWQIGDDLKDEEGNDIDASTTIAEKEEDGINNNGHNPDGNAGL